MSKNKTALITGSAKRVGFELAKKLASDGYNIILHYNSSVSPAAKAQDEIIKMGVECHLIQADMTDLKQYSNIIPQAADFTDDLDLIVNNASIFPEVKFSDTTPELLEENFSIHVKAPFKIIQDYNRLFKKGHVINIIDTSITKNRLTHFAYLLSKKSLHDLTRMSALELAPNVRINGICPTAVDGYSDDLDDQTGKRMLERIPMHSYTSTEKIYKSITYLENSDHTGQIIYCDGGLNLV